MDDHGFAEFYSAAHGRLRSMARALTGDAADAEDLVQILAERLVETWRRRPPEEPFSYARAAMVNLHRSERRRARWRRERASLADLAPSRAEAGAVPSHETNVSDRVMLFHALGQLPLRQRQVVVLRYLEGLSIADVAALLGCGEGTVKRSAHVGLAALRRMVEARDYEGSAGL